MNPTHALAATMKRIDADAVPPQCWLNGGGSTRELHAWPAGADWTLRVSLADIDSDGPFSAYPGVQRWFAVVEGAGVELRFGEQRRRLTPQVAPLHFDGALAPECRRLLGATRDLNLMVRHGRGAMHHAKVGRTFTAEPDGQCGLFTAVAGTWRGEGEAHADVAAHTLLWFQRPPAGRQWFEPARALQEPLGWWLAWAPAGDRA